MIKEKKQILLVESDHVERDVLIQYIQKESLPYEIHSAKTLREGIIEFKKRSFDAVLFGNKLGLNPDFVEAAEDTPVIFLTSIGCEEDVIEAVNLGVKDYIIKDSGCNYLKILALTIDGAISRKSEELVLKEKEENFRSELRTTEEKFSKAFHSSSVVMMICTAAEGRVLEANDAVYKATGFSREEMIGNTLTELGLYPDFSQRDEIRELIKKHGHVDDYELTVRTKSGRLGYCLLSMDVIGIGDQVCVLVVGSEFTEKKKAEEELKLAYHELVEQKKISEKKSVELEKANRVIEEKAALLEEVNKHKSEFLASMSHELRTPLNSIILLSGLLNKNAKDKLSEKEIEYTTIIKSAGNDILELVNDILDMSKVESGRMEVHPTETMIEYLVRKVQGYFNEMAAIKGLCFSVKTEGTLPRYITTDAQKLEQILKNLISNAMKFTEQGSVELSIFRPEPDTDLSMIGLEGLDCKKTVAFSVSDTGTGIPGDKLDYIFESFRQVDSSVSSDYGGTGLGLPISKVLAQLLGGDIQVESEYGRGSVFTVFIPESIMVGKEKEEDIVVDLEKQYEVLSLKIGDALSGKKILIAEDDMRTAYSLMSNLEMYKPEIMVGSDGIKTLEKLRENPDTDIVLLDIVMPEMDGCKVLKEIRKQPEYDKLPVIMISARAIADDCENCMKAGATAYMAKPIDMEELLLTIVRLTSSTYSANQ